MRGAGGRVFALHGPPDQEKNRLDCLARRIRVLRSAGIGFSKKNNIFSLRWSLFTLCLCVLRNKNLIVRSRPEARSPERYQAGRCRRAGGWLAEEFAHLKNSVKTYAIVESAQEKHTERTVKQKKFFRIEKNKNKKNKN